MTIDNMGVMNAGWGICGFTSSLYALYTNKPSEQVKLAKGGGTPTMVLAEVKSYLRMLQADERQDLLSGITAFTRSFGGVFAGFTIEDYITRINGVVSLGASPTDEKFGIAMPPDAVVDYLKRVCDFGGARLVDPGDACSECILGVYKTASPGGPHKGLKHYLYYLNGTIYSWGNQFASVDAAMGKGWDVCYKIAIAG